MARITYRFTVQDSIYVTSAVIARGVGRVPLERLIDDCTTLGYRQMIAIVGDSGYAGSIAVHLRLGFRTVGTLAAVGFKFGRWVDKVLMQRPLGSGDGTLRTA